MVAKDATLKRRCSAGARLQACAISDSRGVVPASWACARCKHARRLRARCAAMKLRTPLWPAAAGQGRTELIALAPSNGVPCVRALQALPAGR